MHHILCLCLVALVAITAHAQTATVVDANGNTVVQVVTTDAQGNPTTSIVGTVTPAGGVPPASSSTILPSSPLAPTPTPPTTTPVTTAPTPTRLAVTPPPVQQGPVGQPDATSFKPGGVTPFTYTTIINGETSVIVDNFTPTNPATQRPSIGASGTILDYSEWLALYGPPPTSSAANAAYTSPPSSAGGWLGLFTSGAMVFLSGFVLALL